MENLFSVKNIIIYVITINLITFLAMYIDKRKAKRGNWRTKESTLFTLVLLRRWNWWNFRDESF